ncbi:helix-turn-helix domain-containing protein, partial [Actinomadura adrarensis]
MSPCLFSPLPASWWPMEEDWPRLADHVIAERVRRDWDRRRLADETGVDYRTLSKLEKGQRVSRDTI